MQKGKSKSRVSITFKGEQGTLKVVVSSSTLSKQKTRNIHSEHLSKQITRKITFLLGAQV